MTTISTMAVQRNTSDTKRHNKENTVLLLVLDGIGDIGSATYNSIPPTPAPAPKIPITNASALL
jgi:hypothetical protein